eukprot:GHVR01191779.1.p1 GENE.GHVR01191779.1~~GHVR01191779.1.p1  ORF type:complete len:133 (+),score=27.43 GHVR01191779.1:72-470(+)
MADVNDNQFLRGKPSTRLFAPPGGTSSICFGDGIHQLNIILFLKCTIYNNIFIYLYFSDITTNPTVNVVKPSCDDINMVKVTAGAPTNTPSVEEVVPKRHQQDPVEGSCATHNRSCVRVRQPPGGGSSIVFG